MTKRYTLLILAYVVPTFLLGFVWHLVLFDSYYKELGIYREAPIIPFGFGSMLLQAALFAWLYPRVVARPESLTDGMKFAAAAALLSWSFTTLAVAAKHPMTSISGFMEIETGFTIVQFLLVGPLWVLAARASGSLTSSDPVGAASR
jgi:hydrogenase-4 membrane subunit HyfE